MTLNLMLTSRSSVYLSGDFRLSYTSGDYEDNLDTQKLIPIFTYGWSALVSFAGVAQTSRGLDVGDWVSQQVDSIAMEARFDELPKKLLTADRWLSKVGDDRGLIFSIVGFIGRRPVAMVISNCSDLNGHRFDPLLPRLRKFESRPKQPEVRVAGERTAVRKQDIDELRKMIRENRNPTEIKAAMAKANRSANERSSTISRECVTGHLLPTGKAEVTPHGIDERAEYLPGFVRRAYAKQGISGFKLKVDEKGNALPPQWSGMTATQIQDPRRRDKVVVFAHAVGNVGEPFGEQPSSGYTVFQKTADEKDVEAGKTTVQINWGNKGNNTMPIEQMRAGRHVTKVFEPAFQFEVEEGWGSYFPETIDALSIVIGPQDSSLIFTSPAKVFDPSNPSQQKEIPAPENADEWVSWFQKHPNLDASKPVPVNVGDVSGVWIDVTATSTPENYPQYCGGQPCIPLFPTRAAPIVSFAAPVKLNDRFVISFAAPVELTERFVIMDVGGKSVVVDVSAPTDTFDAFLPKARKVLDTVKWRSS